MSTDATLSDALRQLKGSVMVHKAREFPGTEKEPIHVKYGRKSHYGETAEGKPHFATWLNNHNVHVNDEGSFIINPDGKSTTGPMTPEIQAALAILREQTGRVQKTAAEDLNHILITGHSGSGKSTLAKKISKETGKPIVALDKAPRFAKLLASLDEGFYKHKDWTDEQKAERISAERADVEEALRSKTPSVIEGVQLLSSHELLKDRGDKKLYLDPSQLALVRRSLSRTRKKGKDKPPGSISARKKAQGQRNVHELYEGDLDQIRQDSSWEKTAAKDSKGYDIIGDMPSSDSVLQNLDKKNNTVTYDMNNLTHKAAGGANKYRIAEENRKKNRLAYPNIPTTLPVDTLPKGNNLVTMNTVDKSYDDDKNIMGWYQPKTNQISLVQPNPTLANMNTPKKRDLALHEYLHLRQYGRAKDRYMENNNAVSRWLQAATGLEGAKYPRQDKPAVPLFNTDKLIQNTPDMVKYFNKPVEQDVRGRITNLNAAKSGYDTGSYDSMSKYVDSFKTKPLNSFPANTQDVIRFMVPQDRDMTPAEKEKLVKWLMVVDNNKKGQMEHTAEDTHTLGSMINKKAFEMPIKKGDILLGGRFKNRRMTVKDIGVDDLGQFTINGQKLLNFRIEKKLPENKKSKKTQLENKDKTPNIEKAAASKTPDWLRKLSVNNKMTAAGGAAIGAGAGMVGNWLAARIMGYDDDFKTYVASMAVGGIAGGVGGYAAGTAVNDKLDLYKADPDALLKDLKKIDESKSLDAFSKWQRKSSLMKPARQAVGRVLTNIKEPVSYDGTQMVNRIKKVGVKGLWDAAVNDKRIYKDRHGTTEARDPLYRAMFDLPTRGSNLKGAAPSDIYRKLSDKQWEFKDTGAGKRYHSELADIIKGGVNDERAAHSVLGGVHIYNAGKPGAKVKDRWDLTSSGKAYLSGEVPYQQKLIHYIRNIGDKLFTNPVTVTQGLDKEGMDKTAAISQDELIAKAQLVGSRGRAVKYGRPEPEDRDHDYAIFEDDKSERYKLKNMIAEFAEATDGYRFKDRDALDGATATSPDTDISVYPSEQKDKINKAWALIEGGKTKEEAWANVEKTAAISQSVLHEKASAGVTEVGHNMSCALGQMVNCDPSEKQKESENYKKAHVNIDGFSIAIENPVGSTRSGMDSDGNSWECPIKADYGYIKGTKGYDKDHVDVTIKPGYQGGKGDVHIVDQVTDSGDFDEHKCILGADNAIDAEAIYNSNYEAGWDGCGSIMSMPVDKFKTWVMSNAPAKGPAKDLMDKEAALHLLANMMEKAAAEGDNPLMDILRQIWEMFSSSSWGKSLISFLGFKRGVSLSGGDVKSQVKELAEGKGKKLDSAIMGKLDIIKRQLTPPEDIKEAPIASDIPKQVSNIDTSTDNIGGVEEELPPVQIDPEVAQVQPSNISAEAPPQEPAILSPEPSVEDTIPSLGQMVQPNIPEAPDSVTEDIPLPDVPQQVSDMDTSTDNIGGVEDDLPPVQIDPALAQVQPSNMPAEAPAYDPTAPTPEPSVEDTIPSLGQMVQPNIPTSPVDNISDTSLGTLLKNPADMPEGSANLHGSVSTPSPIDPGVAPVQPSNVSLETPENPDVRPAVLDPAQAPSVATQIPTPAAPTGAPVSVNTQVTPGVLNTGQSPTMQPMSAVPANNGALGGMVSVPPVIQGAPQTAMAVPAWNDKIDPAIRARMAARPDSTKPAPVPTVHNYPWTPERAAAREAAFYERSGKDRTYNDTEAYAKYMAGNKYYRRNPLTAWAAGSEHNRNVIEDQAMRARLKYKQDNPGKALPTFLPANQWEGELPEDLPFYLAKSMKGGNASGDVVAQMTPLERLTNPLTYPTQLTSVGVEGSNKAENLAAAANHEFIHGDSSVSIDNIPDGKGGWVGRPYEEQQAIAKNNKRLVDNTYTIADTNKNSNKQHKRLDVNAWKALKHKPETLLTPQALQQQGNKVNPGQYAVSGVEHEYNPAMQDVRSFWKDNNIPIKNQSTFNYMTNPLEFFQRMKNGKNYAADVDKTLPDTPENREKGFRNLMFGKRIGRDNPKYTDTDHFQTITRDADGKSNFTPEQQNKFIKKYQHLYDMADTNKSDIMKQTA